ncbi:MAG: DUF2085 domain-containing protein [Bacteroidota bacterium]|nr:DUF2085 domain-containing protein [Bacteroidota bacterium]
MRQSIAYRLALSGVLIWCFLLFVPAIIANLEQQDHSISKSLYDVYSPICHQYESRSIHLGGYKLGVCARCFGIYFGFLLGVGLIPFLSSKQTFPNIFLWLIAISPILIVVALNGLSVHESIILSRFATGLWFGLFSVKIIIPILLEAINELFLSKNIIQGTHYGSKT